MIKQLGAVLLASMLVGSSFAMDRPGESCKNRFGHKCHERTKGCVCKHKTSSMPGAKCRSINGGWCSKGSSDCTCKHHL